MRIKNNEKLRKSIRVNVKVSVEGQNLEGWNVGKVKMRIINKDKSIEISFIILKVYQNCRTFR